MEIKANGYTVNLPEEVIQAIYFAYKDKLEDEDIDFYIQDLRKGQEYLPDNLTIAEVEEQRDILRKYYHSELMDSEDWHHCILEAIDRMSYEKRCEERKKKGEIPNVQL